MSLEPNWCSTIYPVLFAVGQVLEGLAFAVAVLILLAERPPLSRRDAARSPARPRQPAAGVRHVLGVPVVLAVPADLGRKHAGGNALVSARLRGGWEWVAIVAAALSVRPALRAAALPRRQGEPAAAWPRSPSVVLAMRFLDLFWWIEAAFPAACGSTGFSTSRPSSAWAACGCGGSSGAREAAADAVARPVPGGVPAGGRRP